MVVIGPHRNTLARLDDLKATRAALLLAAMDGQSRIFIPYRGRVRSIDVPVSDKLVATIEALDREIALAERRPKASP